MAADTRVIIEGNIAATQTALNSGGSAYTVPAGRELVVVEIRVNNIMTSTPVDKWVEIHAGDGTTKTMIFPRTDVSGDESTGKRGIVQPCQTVLPTGKSLYGTAETADCVSCYITGLERDA